MANRTRSIHQAESANRQKTILVVENDTIIQSLLVDSFSIAGYHCSSVGPEDIASFFWVENMVSSVPDGIVLDVDCRSNIVRDPSDVLSQFCARWRTASGGVPMPPLLLLTTQAEVQNAYEREGYTVLQKPFKPRHLLEQMKSAIERQQ